DGKDLVDGKLARLLKSSKDLEDIIESQRPSPTVASTSAEDQNNDTSTSEETVSTNPSKLFIKPNGAHMRPPLRSSGLRPHGNSMKPPFRPAGHKPQGPSMNPRRPTMNGARP
nr:hypothetical protein [Tanacetum cinerariifolium]